MNIDHREFEEMLRPIIETALANPNGRLQVATARSYLLDALLRNKFNYERAKEVYVVAVDNSVWEFLKDVPLRRAIYRDYQKRHLGREIGGRLANEFVKDTGAEDQRPTRKLFRWLLGA